MIPIGYLNKRVATRPDWIKNDTVEEIYSASSCVSNEFIDYINFWRHNGYWLFDSPAIMQAIAAEQKISLDDCRLFYYEAYEEQFDEGTRTWASFSPVDGFHTCVQVPTERQLLGFDVCTFLCQNKPECSPLSCNSLAENISVNKACLFPIFAEAKDAIDRGVFDNSERGPFRILAVYSVSAGESKAV